MNRMFALSVVLALFAVVAADAAKKEVPAVLNFNMKDIDGKDVNLAQKFAGKTILLVNVASKCGYTKQYKGLQALYEKYSDKGFVIIGVPANNFGAQEPGSNEDIKAYCSTEYKVTFPLLAKVSVKGADKCDLYKFLTSKETNGKFAGEIGWNFEKFMISPTGEVVGRYSSKVTPEELAADVEKNLPKQ